MIKHSFIDNALYGTEDVNNITKNLVGAGIAPFPAKDTYTAEDLNGLTSALAGSGTSLDSCKCTVSGTTVTVAPGIIYFANGVVMTVDSENGGTGHLITVPASTAGYVYAVYSAATQTADIVFGETLPTSATDYIVQLAAISAAGVLTDKRTPARSKVATLGTNATYEFAFTDETVTKSGSGCSIVLPVDAGKFNYIVTTNSYATASYHMTFGIYDLKNSKWIELLTNVNLRYSNYYSRIAGEVSVSVAPGQITISAEDSRYVMGLQMALV